MTRHSRKLSLGIALLLGSYTYLYPDFLFTTPSDLPLTAMDASGEMIGPKPIRAVKSLGELYGAQMDVTELGGAGM